MDSMEPTYADLSEKMKNTVSGRCRRFSISLEGIIQLVDGLLRISREERGFIGDDLTPHDCAALFQGKTFHSGEWSNERDLSLQFHPMDRFPDLYSEEWPACTVSYPWGGFKLKKYVKLFAEALYAGSRCPRGTFFFDIFFNCQNTTDTKLYLSVVDDLIFLTDCHFLCLKDTMLSRGWILHELCSRLRSIIIRFRLMGSESSNTAMTGAIIRLGEMIRQGRTALVFGIVKGITDLNKDLFKGSSDLLGSCVVFDPNDLTEIKAHAVGYFGGLEAVNFALKVVSDSALATHADNHPNDDDAQFFKMITSGGLLSAAAACGYSAGAHHLIQQLNLSVNTKDERGRSPLHMAAWNGHTEVVHILIGAGGDVGAKDDSGSTPLHRCANSDVARTLLAASSAVNIIDDDGATSLHWAAGNGHTEVVQVLLANRADPLAETFFGKIPLDLARESALNHPRELKKKEVEALLAPLCCARAVYHNHYKDMSPLLPGSIESSANLVTGKWCVGKLASSVRKCWKVPNDVAPVSSMLSAAETRDMKDAACKEAPVGDSKIFELYTLKTGLPADAAQGLEDRMNVQKGSFRHKYYGRIAQAVEGIQEEVDGFADGSADPDVCEVKALLQYIRFEETSEKRYKNGIRDLGRGKMRLSDFRANSNAKKAKLSEAELVAIRLYTTIAYHFMNNPLRDDERFEMGRPCPLPVTSYFAWNGIKKLRALHAGSGEVTLWRGMRNLEVAEGFKRLGGTELAFMSTTKELSVAVRYCLSPHSLLFKIVSPNFMTMGADVQWLSAFPGEAEILYPPLTYLKPSGRTQVVEVVDRDGKVCEFTVVEVYPQLG